MTHSPIWNEEKLYKALTNIEKISPFNAFNVCIDSRKVKLNDIFIGLKGQHDDGGIFAESAIEKGAALCIVHKSIDIPDHPKIVKVTDTERALVAMARFRRAELEGQTQFIGITGSAGKTSTKELLALALKSAGNVYSTVGNLNNHLGLPLSIVNIPDNTDYCVLEMGMKRSGEISYLSEIARPSIAIITTIGPAHLEFFESVEDIALAKSEIYDYMQPGQIAIINNDNPYQNIIINKALAKQLMIINFGAKSDSAVKLLKYEIDHNKTKITAECNEQSYHYSFPIIIGKHLALNSLAALAAVYGIGLDLHKAANSMCNFTPVDGRGAVQSLKHNILLIDDSYNANPASVSACLNNLNAYKTAGRRTIAILGDMVELGADGPILHRNLLSLILQEKIDKIFTVGKLMTNLHQVLPDIIKGEHATNAEDIVKIILNEIQPNDIIVVKGSFSMNMVLIVTAILQHFSH